MVDQSPGSIPPHHALRPVAALAYEHTGRRVSPSTIWRWVRRGVRGGRLQAYFILGRWHTTPAEFSDFVDRQSAAMLTPRTRDVDATDDEQLRAAGLL